jgi:hypothetical protein
MKGEEIKQKKNLFWEFLYNFSFPRSFPKMELLISHLRYKKHEHNNVSVIITSGYHDFGQERGKNSIMSRSLFFSLSISFVRDEVKQGGTISWVQCGKNGGLCRDLKKNYFEKGKKRN